MTFLFPRYRAVVATALLSVASPVVFAALVEEPSDAVEKGGTLSDDKFINQFAESFRSTANKDVTTASMADLCRIANSLPKEHQELRGNLYEAVCAGLALIGDTGNYDKLFARVNHMLSSPEYERNCQSCGGRGASRSNCPDCYGDGKCRGCNGKGKVTYPGLRGTSPISGPCRLCSSSGKCHRCNGTGSASHPCDQCRGRGKVFAPTVAKNVYKAALDKINETLDKISVNQGRSRLSLRLPSSNGTLRGVFLTCIVPVVLLAVALHVVCFLVGIQFSSRATRMWAVIIGLAMLTASGWIIGSNLYRMYEWAATILGEAPFNQQAPSDTLVAPANFHTFLWPLTALESGAYALWCVGSLLFGIGTKGNKSKRRQKSDPTFPTLSQLRGWGNGT